MMFRSIRVRLTIWYVVVLAVVLAAFSAGVYFAMRTSLYSNIDDSLTSRAEALDGAIDVNGGAPTLDPDSAPGHPSGEEFVRVFDSEGELTFDNTAEVMAPEIDQNSVTQALGGSARHDSLETSDDTMRVFTTPIRHDSSIVGVLQVGETEDDLLESLRTLLLIIGLAYPVTLVVASAGGVFLAGRALRPVDELTNVARQISADDFSKRLDMKLPDDEVGRLARTFDEMIARLDDAFRRQRQFTADASHELRTPLTSIKGQTEVALQRDRNPEDYREVLRAVNSEVDRMIRLVGSLLTLARADSRQAPISRERVDLSQLVNDAAEQMSAAASAKGIALNVTADAVTLIGDEDLLLQLVLNLFDNAIKYTPQGGSVSVICRADGGSGVVRVTDTGPGISAEHLPHVFDRFYRVDPSRSQAAGGAGLGLSISRWIAESHGGTLSVDSAPGSGSTFIVRVPLSSA